MNGRFGTSGSNNVFPPPEYNIQQNRNAFNSTTPVPSLSALSRLTQPRAHPQHASPAIQHNGVYPYEAAAKSQQQTVLGSMNMPEQPVFDINDFPALGGSRAVDHRKPVAQPQHSPRVISARPPQQEFVAHSEDFPALISPSATTESRTTVSVSGLSSSSGTAPLVDMSSVVLQGSSSRLDSEGSGSTSAVDRVKSKSPHDPTSSRFGLAGLLSVIRMTDPDLNTLALGTDLTTLGGLNLNSTEVLYPTFASPWAEAQSLREPDYVLPYCYYIQPPALKTSHLSKFQVETLFYIFYNMPRDTLQVYAGKELYNRGWHYHKDLKLWLRPPKPPGQHWQYFDINSWDYAIFTEPLAPAVDLMHKDDIKAL
eukprot:195234_1